MPRPSRRRIAFAAAVASLIPEVVVLARRRGRLLAMDTVVRCRAGHLYTTRWIPGASVKAVRLGWWRLQYCPVGRHWTLVTPVKVGDLSGEQRATAASIHDVAVP